MRPKVLYAEDDLGSFRDLAEALDYQGIECEQASDGSEALALATSGGARYAAIVVDLGLPQGNDARLTRRGGDNMIPKPVGLVVAELIRAIDPRTPVLAFTRWRAQTSDQTRQWFRQRSLDEKGCLGLYFKSTPDECALVRRLAALAFPDRVMDRVPYFIIHGHDETTRSSLCRRLEARTRVLPVILDIHRQPGRSIIEQFEDYANNAAGAIALFTEDDWGRAGRAETEEARRVRQNVLFEVGYCLGHFGRRSDRVILLTRGQPELPSDLAGLPNPPIELPENLDLDTGIDRVLDRLAIVLDRYS